MVDSISVGEYSRLTYLSVSKFKKTSILKKRKEIAEQ